MIPASGIKDAKFTKEARYMLNQFWVKAKVKGLLTTRMYNGLYKIAEAQAKLQLRDLVDEEIAEQVLDDVRLTMVQYGETVEKIMGPHEVAIKTCQDILRKSESGMTIQAMCQLAIQEDKNGQIASYLGYIFTIEQNHKLRKVYDSLLNHPCVKKIGSSPTVLKWLSDKPQSDISDISDIKTEKIYNEKVRNSDENRDKIQGTMSDVSDVSDSALPIISAQASSYVKSVLLNSVLPKTLT